MKQKVPARVMREHLNLEQLERQAAELLAGHANAIGGAAFSLTDAQLVVARSYGFDSWPKLKAYVDGVTVRRLAGAVRAGDAAQVRAMLEARPELINVDMAENDEHRALHYAVFARSPEMVKLLMEFGADARKGIYPHRSATTALTIARERGYAEIVAIVEEAEGQRRGTPAPAADELGALIDEGSDAEVLAMLEGDPALAGARNRNGCMPLHLAAAEANETLIAWLLAHGADSNAGSPGGLTPLDLAAEAGSEGEPVLQQLRAHGAAMTARAAVALGDAEWLQRAHAEGRLENRALLTIAVKHGRPETLKLLLDFGFDPNEPTRLESLEEIVYSLGSPLWHCANAGQYAMAKLLLERGADPNVHVYAAGPSVHKAFEQKDWAMLKLLQQYGGVLPPVSIGLFRERGLAKEMLAGEAAGQRLPDGILEGRNVSEDLLRGAADSGDPEIVRMALPGVDWSRDDGRWFWILMQAVWAGSAECLALILSRCNPNLRHPRFGRTILHDVAGLGLKNTAERSPVLAALLLDAGANVNERDDVLRSTPLGWACRWGKLELAKLLLERGANPVEADAEPWATPRAWAEKGRHHAILALLGEFER